MPDIPTSIYADGKLLGNTLTEWLIGTAVATALWFALWLLRGLIASRYARLSAARSPTVLRLVGYLAGNTKQILFLAVALYAAEEFLTLPSKVAHAVSNTALILTLLQVGLWAGRTLRFYLEIKEAERAPDQVFAGSLNIIKFVSGLLIWSLLVLVALDNLGVNITALLAGLGVGGVAVALALQNVLGDLFASLSIALDKPFVVGDSLTIDTYAGKVEHIGIKTTRLRSETGEQIILSNADILKSRVRNFGRAAELRCLVSLRVAYDTPADTVRSIPGVLKALVSEHAQARFERCHLKTLGDDALLFELTYFVRQPTVNPQLDLQQAVNLRILEEFNRLGVGLAQPTRIVVSDQRGSGRG